MSAAPPPFWILETRGAGYSFGLDPGGRLVHTSWGARLPRQESGPPSTRPRT